MTLKPNNGTYRTAKELLPVMPEFMIRYAIINNGGADKLFDFIEDRAVQIDHSGFEDADCLFPSAFSIT
jgi:hypothetical protein